MYYLAYIVSYSNIAVEKFITKKKIGKTKKENIRKQVAL